MEIDDSTDSQHTEKVQKVLARIGYGSRRTCEGLVEDGRITINGELVNIGARVDIENDELRVDGKIVGIRPELVYYLLNKPSGYISSVTDPFKRPTIVDLVPSDNRVFPVGRLDLDTEGLIILTNDGDLTNLITHPSAGVEKEYLVHLSRDVSDKTVNKMRRGVPLEDGITAPAKISHLSGSVIKVVIHEGRNRQVRRMCEFYGFNVLRLVRIRIGPIRDGNLPPGKWRNLSYEEVIQLRESTKKSPKDKGLEDLRRRLR